jgi:uridine phosphorylase
LVALAEIDLRTRTRKRQFPRMHVLRVGTSGAIQASTALGTSIVTTYAIGMDNTGLFYEAPCADEVCERLEQELGNLVRGTMRTDSRFYGKIHPYVTRAAPDLVEAVVEAGERLGVPVKRGLTASNPGFFAPQGRDIARIPPSLPGLDQILAEYDPRMDGQRVENMEMEASFLIHFLSGLGHGAGAICPTVAHRRAGTFAYDYQEAIKVATRVALLALATVRGRAPDRLPA